MTRLEAIAMLANHHLEDGDELGEAARKLIPQVGKFQRLHTAIERYTAEDENGDLTEAVNLMGVERDAERAIAAAVERERDLLAETARHLTRERDEATQLYTLTSQRLGRERDAERAAAAAACRIAEAYGAALRAIVGLWYKYEKLWNAGHVPLMQSTMAAARDLIGEGER